MIVPPFPALLAIPVAELLRDKGPRFCAVHLDKAAQLLVLLLQCENLKCCRAAARTHLESLHAWLYAI